jgi:Na+/proline symporter
MASSIDSLLAATSDLLIRDVHEGLLKKKHDERNFRKVSGTVIIGVGIFAWILAAPKWPIINALFISGPLVGSLIWPVIAGLFWKQINRRLVITGILLGCATGVTAYFTLGWFTASLVGTAVSMVFTIAARYMQPENFPKA